jgi:hypothetical protein
VSNGGTYHHHLPPSRNARRTPSGGATGGTHIGGGSAMPGSGRKVETSPSLPRESSWSGSLGASSTLPRNASYLASAKSTSSLLPSRGADGDGHGGAVPSSSPAPAYAAFGRRTDTDDRDPASVEALHLRHSSPGPGGSGHHSALHSPGLQSMQRAGETGLSARGAPVRQGALRPTTNPRASAPVVVASSPSHPLSIDAGAAAASASSTSSSTTPAVLTPLSSKLRGSERNGAASSPTSASATSGAGVDGSGGTGRRDGDDDALTRHRRKASKDIERSASESDFSFTPGRGSGGGSGGGGGLAGMMGGSAAGKPGTPSASTSASAYGSVAFGLGTPTSSSSSADFVVLDTVPVTVGARSGLTASPGDVCETVVHFKGKEGVAVDPKAQAISDSVPYLQSLSAITWRGHNPALFKVQQVRAAA